MANKIEVWVLIGHYKRKPSELLGVYKHYERGQQGMQAASICGNYEEVALTRVDVHTEREFKLKKAKS